MLGVMNLLLDLFQFLCNGHMGFRGASPTASITCVWHFIANFLAEAFPISGGWIGSGKSREKNHPKSTVRGNRNPLWAGGG